MRFGESIFYNTKNLSMAEKLSMFRDCMEISYDWQADMLDCAVSMSRQHFECSFEEILSYLKEAFTLLYSSKLYAQLDREETKLWHLSVPTLYSMFKEEQETGKITYPEEA